MSIYENDYQGQRNQGGEVTQPREGRVARTMIEEQAVKLPSDAFLWGAGAAMLGSLAFQIFGPRPGKARLFGKAVESRAPLATFVGQWVPTLLLFGIYNKITKVAGGDRMSR